MGSFSISEQGFSMKIEEMVKRASEAQKRLEALSEELVDQIVLSIAWAVLKEENNDVLSKYAVEKTGLGNVKDKKIKNLRKTLGLLRDLKKSKTFGIIENDESRGLVKIARPKGVIAAITPSTNPIATPLNNIINAVKCRNAVIIASSPKGEFVLTKLFSFIFEELAKLPDFPFADLIQKLPPPVSHSATMELMKQADSLVVTGSPKNVKRSYESGTPSFGVGTGNVVVIVDETADLSAAASKIEKSKTFDNATSCSSENSLVVLEEIFADFLVCLKREGGVLLNEEEKLILKEKLWQNGKLNPDLIAKPAKFILSAISPKHVDLDRVRFLMVEESGVGEKYPFCQEKLSPVLTIYRAGDFDEAMAKTKSILDHQGRGHSCGIHSNDQGNIHRLGLDLPVSRVIVNQAHCYAAGGNFNNSLPFTLSLGCGSWGNNSTSENIHHKHYLNITQVVYPIENQEPTLENIFQGYWEKYGK